MNCKIVFVNILVIVIIVACLGGGAYSYNQVTNYVSTDNARVDGQQAAVSATAAGRLTSWNGQLGKTFNTGDTVGSILPAGQTTKLDIDFPVAGTIVQQSAVMDGYKGVALAPGMSATVRIHI